MEISDWFKTQDYNTGVELYANSKNVKTRTLSTLKRGKSNRNMALLISELRKLKNTRIKPKKEKASVSVQKIIKTPQKQTEVQAEQIRNQQKEESSKSYFKKINYGDLPKELKLRFRQLKDIFYDMCDLKFMLNDLPDEAEEDALKIIMKIEDLDEQRSNIWNELDHWKNYKTILPTKTDDDFSDLTPQKLFLKKASLKSSIHKMAKRIEKWEEKSAKETDKKEARKLKQQIDRTTKKLHKHKLSLQKIEKLL